MAYAAKLRDPRWQRKRLEIFQRDNFECILCGDGISPLHAHHSYYVSGKLPWQYPDWSIWTLCESCHKEIPEYLVGWFEPHVEFWDQVEKIGFGINTFGGCARTVQLSEAELMRSIFHGLLSGLIDATFLRACDDTYAEQEKKYLASLNSSEGP